MGWKPSMSLTLFGFTSIWQTSWTHAVFGTSKVGSFFVKSNMTSNVVVCNGFSPPLTSMVWPLVALCSKRCVTHTFQKYWALLFNKLMMLFNKCHEPYSERNVLKIEHICLKYRKRVISTRSWVLPALELYPHLEVPKLQ